MGRSTVESRKLKATSATRSASAYSAYLAVPHFRLQLCASDGALRFALCALRSAISAFSPWWPLPLGALPRISAFHFQLFRVGPALWKGGQVGNLRYSRLEVCATFGVSHFSFSPCALSSLRPQPSTNHPQPFPPKLPPVAFCRGSRKIPRGAQSIQLCSAWIADLSNFLH